MDKENRHALLMSGLLSKLVVTCRAGTPLVQFSVFVLFLCLSLALTSCTEEPQSPGNTELAEVNDVRVVTVRPEEELVDEESFPLPNCGGSSPVSHTLGADATVTRSVEVELRATARGGGEVEIIPETTRLKLEIEVQAAYQQTYSSALSRLDTLVMSAAPYTHVVYGISWYEQTFASTVAFSSGGNVYEVPYVYKLQVPKLSKSSGIVCPDVLVEGTSSGSAAVTQTETTTENPANSEAIGETYDCMGVVTPSRPVIQQGTGVACWLKLEDGASARLVFNDVAQITYRTATSGSDIYFKIVNAGDELGDVLGATIRPEPFVMYGYGGYEEVRNFEISYHTMSSGWVACLRDANNEFQPMTSFCN